METLALGRATAGTPTTHVDPRPPRYGMVAATQLVWPAELS
jgi:hypothetical protein